VVEQVWLANSQTRYGPDTAAIYPKQTTDCRKAKAVANVASLEDCSLRFRWTSALDAETSAGSQCFDL